MTPLDDFLIDAGPWVLLTLSGLLLISFTVALCGAAPARGDRMATDSLRRGPSAPRPLDSSPSGVAPAQTPSPAYEAARAFASVRRPGVVPADAVPYAEHFERRYGHLSRRDWPDLAWAHRRWREERALAEWDAECEA